MEKGGPWVWGAEGKGRRVLPVTMAVLPSREGISDWESLREAIL